ncbi:hypothetical protein NSQ95_07440 [Psychrobacillus sp. FSL W7-1457]|uniref:hypothetical protein n=1 Tax=Psychrobacillus sp. FSL W7-1457 TaxID=2954547 RepID=UPI00315AB9BC
MTSYVLLLKEYEDDETVVYKFGPNEEVMGKIELNKITRNFSELESLPDYLVGSVDRLGTYKSKKIRNVVTIV